MVESYKLKSKVATAISFLAAFIVYIGKDELVKLMPSELAYLAPVIVLVCGYIATQKTENTRVDIAEQLVHEQYQDVEEESPVEEEVKEDNIVVNLTLDGEEIVSGDGSDDSMEVVPEDDDEA